MIHHRVKRGPPKLVVISNGRELPKDEGRALLLEASRSLAANSILRRLERAEQRNAHTPDRLSIEKAMLGVEDAFVKALWVLQRTEGVSFGQGYSTASVEYTHDAVDIYGQAVANGGWRTPAPRPAVPSAKEISSSEKIHLWVVRRLTPLHARVLTVGAMSKCGDVDRRIHWERVRTRLPELGGYSARSLRGIYTGALRDIVAELSISHAKTQPLALASF